MNKTYNRINWENEPSEKTPVNDQNLNRMDGALDEIDNRVIALDKTKANITDISMLFADVFMNDTTGVITFTRKNGSVLTIDTPLGKIALNIYYDPTTEKLILPLIDGTQWEVDLSRLITEYNFADSDTIAFIVGEDGMVTAKIKEGSIEEKHLRPDYLADIKVEVEKAESSSSLSERSAMMAESYAHGDTGTREGEDEDNAMEYARQAKESADRAAEIAGGDFIPVSEKGANDGVATLGSDGKVPKKQLPENIGSVIGVKGNAESEYRTGNVNITPGDIGLGNVPNVTTNDQTPTFTQSDVRENIASGDKLSLIFGKIMKWFDDLKSVAFSGSYNDLSDKPDALKNPNALTVKANGTSLGAYDGSVEKEFNITASGVGAVEAGGDIGDNIATFDTNDTTDEDAESWTSTDPITSGSTISGLMSRISTMIKNTRYLYKLMGTTDISTIGNGTLTGAISELNTGLGNGGQSGSILAGEIRTGDSKDTFIQFKQEFSSIPNVFVCLMGQGKYLGVNVQVVSITTSGFTARVNNGGTMSYAPTIMWLTATSK